MSDGGQILVNELDIDAIARNELRTEEDHENRALEQELEVAVMQDLQRGLRQRGLL